MITVNSPKPHVVKRILDAVTAYLEEHGPSHKLDIVEGVWRSTIQTACRRIDHRMDILILLSHYAGIKFHREGRIYSLK